MADGLHTTIRRNQGNAEDGQTGFCLDVGYNGWHIELEELAALCEDADDLRQLLKMPPGTTCEVIVRVTRVEKKADA